MNIQTPRRPVIVEKKKKRTLNMPASKALSASPVDFATVAAIATSSVSHQSDCDKVRSFLAAGKYEDAAKLAAKIINSDSDSGFFTFGGSDEYGLVQAWFDRMVGKSSSTRNSEFCELTPELAQILLLNNKGNRRVNAPNLAGIMRDMAAGRWLPNGETVIVSKDGMLNDGQHRCYGALLTNSCIETAIAFGVDRDSMGTIDIGRKRTGADRLGIGGVHNYVPMSAISNLILEMKNSRAPTPAETDEFFFEHRTLIEQAHSAAGANMKGVGLSAAGAACAYLISVGHRQPEVSAFFASVRSGEMMPKRDPRMVLHKSIFDARFKIKLSRENWVRAFVAHFIAHRNGKTMSSVTWDVFLTWGI